jgi:hypothetical protein
LCPSVVGALVFHFRDEDGAPKGAFPVVPNKEDTPIGSDGTCVKVVVELDVRIILTQFANNVSEAPFLRVSQNDFPLKLFN